MIDQQNAKHVEEPNIQRIDGWNFPTLKPESYFCTSEWHLARLQPSAALIYPFALYLAHDSKRFSVSATGLAEYFDRDESTIRRGYNALEKLGFFVKTIQGTFNSSVYRVLTHQEWATTHPNQCPEKLENPWDKQENDPLGQELYFASGCRVKWLPFQVNTLRNLGIQDHEIVEKFEIYYEQTGQFKKATNVPSGFIMELRRKWNASIDAVH